MNAYLTDGESRHFLLSQPPIVIAADNANSRNRAMRTVEASGFRCDACVGLDAALERLDQQAAALAWWIEVEDEPSEQLDALLDKVRSDAVEGRRKTVIAAPRSMLDVVFARASAPGIDILIDADDWERAAALAVASTADRHSISEAAADRNAARLRQLSEEVSRIASTLARLSTGPQPLSQYERQPEIRDAPDISTDVVRAVIRARRMRSRYFPEELFADPAWDMLLDLFQAEIAQLRVPVSSLCIAAAVPATTALRWLKTMTEQGLFVRRADPHDGRRVFVELASTTSHALRRYFADVGQVATI
jgi:hypothetical protein